jgi:hypothetical protein
MKVERVEVRKHAKESQLNTPRVNNPFMFTV